MPFRPFPTDQPDRETTWRRGKIQARTAAVTDGDLQTLGYHYTVNFPDLGTELAFAVARYEINATVHCQWRNEGGIWQIMP